MQRQSCAGEGRPGRYNCGMATVEVTLPVPAPIHYDVRIDAGLLGQMGTLVRQVAPAPTCGLVSDSNVAALYLRPARESLEAAGYRVIEYVFPAGESHKTLQTAAGGLDVLLSARVERATPLVALGGGVVGDLTGFLAATLLRGVPFVQAPTTLLSAVDASVGGKVGVDHPTGKNLIGAFHQPRLVISDVATYQTLPNREMRCGLAECIKHGIIRDRDLFAFLIQHMAKIMACDVSLLTELVAWNVRIKAAVVREDPYEKGVRALLNLGHTFGHALEAVAGYSGLQHGEAVALGTIAACRLAYHRGQMTAEDVGQVVNLVDLAGLPTNLPSLDIERTYAAMGTDKKVAGGKLRFVLPRGIGNAEVVTGVDPQDVKHALKSLILPAYCAPGQAWEH